MDSGAASTQELADRAGLRMNRRLPLWARLVLAPIRMVCLLLAAAVSIVLVLAGEDAKAARVMDAVIDFGNGEP